MATHAHSTRTPLLPQSGNPRPLLGQGLGRQLGPVTQAIRTMRLADPAAQAIAAIECGLEHFFAEPVLDPRQFTHGIRALSRTEVENLVEGLVDLLDGWDGDADFEPDNEHGGDVQDEPHDAEEDMGAEEDDGSAGLVPFDGTNYRRVRS